MIARRRRQKNTRLHNSDRIVVDSNSGPESDVGGTITVQSGARYTEPGSSMQATLLQPIKLKPQVVTVIGSETDGMQL